MLVGPGSGNAQAYVAAVYEAGEMAFGLRSGYSAGEIAAKPSIARNSRIAQCGQEAETRHGVDEVYENITTGFMAQAMQSLL